MSVYLDQSFQNGIPANFATLAAEPSGGQTMSFTYDSANRCAVYSKDAYNGTLILNDEMSTPDSSIEIWATADYTINGTGTYLGAYFRKNKADGNAAIILSLNGNKVLGYNPNSGNWGSGTNLRTKSLEYNPIDGYIQLRFDTKMNSGSRTFWIYRNGYLLDTWETNQPSSIQDVPVFPSIYGRQGKFRIHRIALHDDVDYISEPFLKGGTSIIEPNLNQKFFQIADFSTKSWQPEIWRKDYLFKTGSNKITGRLLDDAFEPMVTRVIVRNRDGYTIDEVISDSEGNYEFKNLSWDFESLSVLYFDTKTRLWNPVALAAYAGDGHLSGSYRIKDKPQKNIQVRVFAEDTNEYLGSTTTNEQGLFRVDNLNKGESFYLVFREPNGLWEDRVSSRRKPV